MTTPAIGSVSRLASAQAVPAGYTELLNNEP